MRGASPNLTRLGERCKRCTAMHLSPNLVRLGERCIAVPLQVQDSDKTKLEVHGSVRVQ